MTPPRPSLRPHSMPAHSVPEPTGTGIVRRGLLLGTPTLLLAGCGFLGGPGEVPEGAAPAGGAGGADAGSEEPEETEETEPAGVATVTLDGVVIEDVMDVGDLVEPLETSQTLLHPWAAVTVTGMVVLDELSPEKYTELTGEDVPPADDDDEVEATVIRPGDLRAFLIAAWESTDSEWSPATRYGPSTTLSLAVDGNVETRLVRAEEDKTEHSGAVLLTVPASPQPEAATVHAEIEGGTQQISLVDGSIVSTAAPRLYSGDLEVEISDAEIFETEVPDGFGQDMMPLRGTVDSAYLTPFIYDGGAAGSTMGWADEDEIHVVISVDWEKDYSANVDDLSRISLELADGTELTPQQEHSRVFDDHSANLATFTVPAETETATVVITPRFQQVLDDDFDETHDPITATLTFT